MNPITQAVRKVTSLELSKALKAAGAKQESERCWRYCWDTSPDEHPTLGKSEDVVEVPGHMAVVAAYDCPELLEELPGYVSDGIKEYWLTLEQLADEYHAMYYEYHHGCFDKEAVEALGKLLLWGLENGHCEKGKS